jgi:glycosyltransferase involved in cell wall biosynthesis
MKCDGELMAKTLIITVIIPVFNDWISASHLFKDLERAFPEQEFTLDIIVVNDASTIPICSQFHEDAAKGVIRSITILDLRTNVGHQFAIATGLVFAAKDRIFDAVLIMDADGEDRAADARKLVDTWQTNKQSIIVAHRAKRSESLGFKAFYLMYRGAFSILTGRPISFGNFSLIPNSLLPSVLSRPELVHHIAATLLRTRLPLVRIATERGQRYAGISQMNMPTLVLHAVGAFAVFSDILFSRMLIASSALGVLCGTGITIVTIMRLFTNLAFPNWATTVIGFLMLLAAQAVVLIFCTGFLLLTNRMTMLLTSLETLKLIGGVTRYGANAN